MTDYVIDKNGVCSFLSVGQVKEVLLNSGDWIQTNTVRMLLGNKRHFWQEFFMTDIGSEEASHGDFSVNLGAENLGNQILWVTYRSNIQSKPGYHSIHTVALINPFTGAHSIDSSYPYYPKAATEKYFIDTLQPSKKATPARRIIIAKIVQTILMQREAFLEDFASGSSPGGPL